MNFRSWLIDFVRSFLLVLVVASVITYLWNLVFHASGAVDWETSFQLAIILGIVLSSEMGRERRQRKQ
jgi:hypothetical protein